MKITFVMARVDMSGGARVVATYAERLQRRGHDVSVISCPTRQASQQEQLRSVLKGKGLMRHPKNLPSHFDRLDIPRHIIDRWRPIEDRDVPDADVVIATWWETAHWVNKLSAAKGAKVYFIQHHEVFEYLPKQQVRATYTLPLHKITISRWLLDLMDKKYGDRQVSLVPNSVDTRQFFAPPRSKQPVPTIGLLYSPIAWKGCAVSFKALALVAEKLPNLRIVAFGASHPSADLPLPANVEYFYQPAQDAIKNIYAQCDVWLFGSRSEGFGLPVLEAMACRTPVIGTPAGAVPELLADGAGILVKPEDPEDMARAIERLCSLSDVEWQQMSNAAFNTATCYSWEDATTLFETALYTAIERQAPVKA